MPDALMSLRNKIVAASVFATGFGGSLSLSLPSAHTGGQVWGALAAALATGAGGLAAYLTKPVSAQAEIVAAEQTAATEQIASVPPSPVLTPVQIVPAPGQIVPAMPGLPPAHSDLWPAPAAMTPFVASTPLDPTTAESIGGKP